MFIVVGVFFCDMVTRFNAPVIVFHNDLFIYKRLLKAYLRFGQSVFFGLSFSRKLFIASQLQIKTGAQAIKYHEN